MAPTEIYALSLHDALPISRARNSPGATRRAVHGSTFRSPGRNRAMSDSGCGKISTAILSRSARSEEHTSELQSRLHLVCRLLLEKKKQHRRRREPVYSRELHSLGSVIEQLFFF